VDRNDSGSAWRQQGGTFAPQFQIRKLRDTNCTRDKPAVSQSPVFLESPIVAIIDGDFCVELHGAWDRSVAGLRTRISSRPVIDPPWPRSIILSGCRSGLSPGGGWRAGSVFPKEPPRRPRVRDGPGMPRADARRLDGWAGYAGLRMVRRQRRTWANPRPLLSTEETRAQESRPKNG
jgi:hypothetical protein